MFELENYSSDLTAAGARIVDVDVAAEAARRTKHQIVTHAGSSVLAQANQAYESALSLLG